MKLKKLIIYILVSILLIASAILTSCTCNISDGRAYLDCYGDILPCETYNYNIGSPTLYFHNLWVESTYTETINANGDLYIDCGVNSTLVLNDHVYKDIVVNMTTAKPPSSLPPTWRPYLQSQVPAFDQNNINVMYFSAEIPSGYVEGTDLSFHIHTVYPDNNAGNSVWYFSWVWENIDDTYPAVADSTTTIVASPTTADYHQSVEIEATVDGTGKEAQSVLLCSIQRLGNHGSDTYPNEIYLISADFNYQADQIGAATPAH